MVGYFASTSMEADSSTSEPGYYADGKFGIRIENVVIVRETSTPNNFGEKGFLRFEHVTMVCRYLRLKRERSWF